MGTSKYRNFHTIKSFSSGYIQRKATRVSLWKPHFIPANYSLKTHLVSSCNQKSTFFCNCTTTLNGIPTNSSQKFRLCQIQGKLKARECYTNEKEQDYLNLISQDQWENSFFPQRVEDKEIHPGTDTMFREKSPTVSLQYHLQQTPPI